ncbi:MAG: low molecular weight phosphotyrosine protein phosphatase [Bacteroides sp.]|nr:low molecular weight phosphotyrosine protein phosphatase [Bacteroides sp.]
MNSTSESKRPTLHARAAVAEAVEAARESDRPLRILFVCLGNICRSPAAHGIAEQEAARRNMKIEIDSAGFYGGHAGDLPDPRMRRAAAARGYTLNHRARKIRSFDFDDFDIVIGMDDNNISDLQQLAGTVERARKIVRMTDFATAHPDYDYVPDPYYEGPEGFEIVLDLLEDSCSELLDLCEEKGLK